MNHQSISSSSSISINVPTHSKTDYESDSECAEYLSSSDELSSLSSDDENANDLSSLNEMDHSSTFDLDSDDELDVDSSMFQPLYENASITVCGAYCAIMEFKRACRLPFTTIAMLLNLLNLLCPPDNHLPQSLYKFKQFFEKFSSFYEKDQFCSDCLAQYRKHQSRCDNTSCRRTEPSTMISFNPTKAIR